MSLYINDVNHKNSSLNTLFEAVKSLPSPLPDIKVDFDSSIYSMQPARGPDLLITTREEITNQIKGKNGYIFSKKSKCDDKAYHVYQEFVGFVTNDKIGTTNVQDCVALIVQDKKIKKTALAHISVGTEKASIQSMLSCMPKGEKEVIMIGGRYDKRRKDIKSISKI